MVNLCPIETWGINPYSTIAKTWSPSWFDTVVTHNGNISIRNEGTISSTFGFLNREVNSEWIRVYPGNKMKFSGWIKTNPYSLEPENPYRGARFGVDFLGSTSHLGGIAWDSDYDLPQVDVEGGWDVQAEIDNWVPMDSDWTYREIKFTVPETLAGGPVYGVICWFQPWLGYRDGQIIKDLEAVWMSEPKLEVVSNTVDNRAYFDIPDEDYILPYTGVGADYLWFSNADPSIWTQWTFDRSYKGKTVTFNGHIDLVEFWKTLFHTNQISICFTSASKRQASWYDFTKFSTVLNMFGERNSPIIVAHYPAWDAVGHCGSDELKNDWLTFVNDWKGDKRIAAIKLYGEPVGAIDNGQGTDTVSWKEGMSVRDMARWFVQLVKDIHAIDPDRVVIYPFMGLSYWNPQDLFDDIEDTGIFNEPNVIFDIVHPYWFEGKYETDDMTPANKPAFYEAKDIIPWINKVGAGKVWCGETFMFTHEANEITGYPPVLENQATFLLNMINIFVKHKMAFNIWGLLTTPLDYKSDTQLFYPTNEHVKVIDNSTYGKVKVNNGGGNVVANLVISGIVKDADTQAPIEGVNGSLLVSTPIGDVTLTVVTGADGTYSATQQANAIGLYGVVGTFSKAGYITVTTDLKQVTIEGAMSVTLDVSVT